MHQKEEKLSQLTSHESKAVEGFEKLSKILINLLREENLNEDCKQDLARTCGDTYTIALDEFLFRKRKNDDHIKHLYDSLRTTVID